MAEDKKKIDSAELTKMKESLSGFLSNNSHSSIREIVGEDTLYAIDGPWGDKSVAVNITNASEDLFEALNSVILPARFSALYHIDTRKMEIIWTAYELPENQKEVAGRKFSFTYAGNKHACSFGRSSDRLIEIAGAAVPLKMSDTSFRNIQSFRSFSRRLKNPKLVDRSIAEPVSFWIENIDWDEAKFVELANNLNFYLSYYDNDGPMIAIHQTNSLEKPHPKHRYIAGKFPATIKGKRLDNNLLSFWEASAGGDAARRFQYYYRIIEYASFFYLESSAKIAVKRILASPDIGDDVDKTTEKLMSAFQMSKLDEYAKFSQLLTDVIDPKILWAAIKENVPAFSKDIKFDGGFVLKAIIAPSAKEATFLPKGVETFTKAIRDIRNALSHGRDFKSASVIMPTQRNLNALRPWSHLIAVAAGQVVLFKDVT